jgi:hypothetical protein
MSTSNVIKMPGAQCAMPALNLPEPRVWTPKHLAEFLSMSVSWVRERARPKAEDPIPRIAGLSRLRFDTASPHFQDWMRRQLGCGYVDNEVSDD